MLLTSLPRTGRPSALTKPKRHYCPGGDTLWHDPQKSQSEWLEAEAGGGLSVESREKAGTRTLQGAGSRTTAPTSAAGGRDLELA